ncbi:MAG: DUF222 domain-containing protein [Pseudonocardiales bacterium]|nr:DUF222 domain-containing protein [Pseudonocardiales bacterium]
MPDTRAAPQRQTDALIELCERVRVTDNFPTTGGEPPHVTVTINWDALRAALGTAAMDYGQLVRCRCGSPPGLRLHTDSRGAGWEL